MQTKRCKQCKKERRLTQFTLRKNAIEIDDLYKKRVDKCRICNYDGLTADQRHLILREAYRHYSTFRQYVKDTGKESIAYSIPSGLGDDTYVPVTISFIDLERALNTVVLSKRKEQAFYLHIIEDMLQREVAEIMDITTVSVGQYVDQAMQQLAEVYFENEKPLDSDISRDLNA